VLAAKPVLNPFQSLMHAGSLLLSNMPSTHTRMFALFIELLVDPTCDPNKYFHAQVDC